MKAVRASDSSCDAAIWPVEKSQSSSCSSMVSESQCKQQARAARERDLAERNAQRKFEGA